MKIERPIIIKNNEKTNSICQFCGNTLEFIDGSVYNELEQYFDEVKQVETVRCLWTEYTIELICRNCHTEFKIKTRYENNKKFIFKNDIRKVIYND